MRLYAIGPADVGTAISCPIQTTIDDRGNQRLIGLDAMGRAIIVVIADDDPDYVITTYLDD